ncbi:MAG TPA: hypothetical protein VFG87_24535 [Amycolatopsis sp.]|nr:hypothetical protein [Amycolatopsis sp.]
MKPPGAGLAGGLSRVDTRPGGEHRPPAHARDLRVRVPPVAGANHAVSPLPVAEFSRPVAEFSRPVAHRR